MNERPGEVTNSCRFARPELQHRKHGINLVCRRKPNQMRTGSRPKISYIPNPVDLNSFRKIMAAIRKPSSVTASAVIMMVRSWPSTGVSNWAIR